MSHRILLLPLDERPCNYWYPRYLAPIAGVELLMPPVEMMPAYRKPGNTSALSHWFLDRIGAADAVVVSVDLLGYGGLIPSRIGGETSAEVIDRLDILREARRRKPDLYMAGFNVIMRASNSYSNFEEPEYWSRFGRDIYRISVLTDRVERLREAGDEAELSALKAKVDSAAVEDYFNRRSRNHAVNRAMIQMAAEGVLDFLFLSQDDASEYGVPAREQRVLRADIREANAGDRVVVYPGADEVGSVLLARAACQLAGYTPTFFPRYASTNGPNIVALFEDRPLDQTVRGEVFCAGGVVADAPRDADIMLFVNTPGTSQSYPGVDNVSTTVETPGRNLPDFLSALRHYATKNQVAVADVAYCNGADPALVPLLPRFLGFPQLAGYAGWNTAANTIGTVVAHAAMRMVGVHSAQSESLAREAAHQTFLFHRVLEDWGYQTVVRTELQNELLAAGEDAYKPSDIQKAWGEVERRLYTLGSKIFGKWFADQGSSPDPTIRPEGWELKGVTLPWDRMFEVGIDLEVGVEGGQADEQQPSD